MIFKLNDKFEKTFIVSDTVYEGFMETFKDTNALHTDEKFAKQNGFKGKVMHGNILNGFLSYFVGQCLPQKQVIIHAQEIQFKNQVYLNDELHSKLQLQVFTNQLKQLSLSLHLKTKH